MKKERRNFLIQVEKPKYQFIGTDINKELLNKIPNQKINVMNPLQ